MRMKVLMAWFPAFFSDGGWMGLAGRCIIYALQFDYKLETIAAHYNHIREIPIGAKYEIRMSVGGWEEDKWVWANLPLHPHSRLS